MSLAELLNTDVDTLGARLKQGVLWWFDELRDLARPLTAQSGAVPSVVVEPLPNGLFLVKRAGHEDEAYVAGTRPFRAALALPAQTVLVQDLSRPALAERDLQRLIALDLDRLTPFEASAVYHDIRVRSGQDASGRRQIRLAVTPRLQADELLERAIEAGLEPTALIALHEGEVIDFLPAMRTAGVLGPQSRSYLLWLIIAALLALNLGIAIWKDVQATNALEAAVTAQAPLVAQIQTLRQQTADLQAQAAHQAAARLAGEPLRVIDGLSRGLPNGAWVQRMVWDGTTIKATGSQIEGVDVVGALRRDPLFTDVRTTEGGSSSSGTSFDVLATVTSGMRR